MSTRVREAVEALLKVLPDSRAQTDECWEWCWNELNDAAQTAVADARKLGMGALAELATRSESTRLTPPTHGEIAAYRDLFRSELDKNMHNSSGSPSTDAHTVALHAFVEARNKERK